MKAPGCRHECNHPAIYLFNDFFLAESLFLRIPVVFEKFQPLD